MGDAMDFFSEVAQKIVVAIAMFCLTTIVSFFIGRWWGPTGRVPSGRINTFWGS